MKLSDDLCQYFKVELFSDNEHDDKSWTIKYKQSDFQPNLYFILPYDSGPNIKQNIKKSNKIGQVQLDNCFCITFDH